jgi:V8-like Glu-specific endopeptidase
MRPGWAGRRGGRHALRAHRRPRPVTWAISTATAAACGILLMTPTASGAVRLASQLADAATTLSVRATDAPATLAGGRAFKGTPAVGALFMISGGELGRHFCSASVVDSTAGDLVITAAHCVTRMAPGQIAFVPGYHDGRAPYGVWLTSKVLADRAWRTAQNPDHDVAFLVVHKTGASTRIQDVTGGEKLGTGWGARVWVHVLGYPDATERPVTCHSQTKPFGAREMEFDCGGYTDGTSGGPFLARVDSSTGQGTVIGVIGGYEEGGDIASVSYSPRFGSAVQSLYQAAIAAG